MCEQKSTMEQEDELLALAGVYLIKELILPKKKRPRRPQKSWIEKRAIYSHVNLIKEFMNEPNDFRNYLRMDETTYRYLLELIRPSIKRDDTVMKRSITPHERLSATLRFLATGRTYEDLKFSTCISKSALSNIIPETCDVIYTVLKQDYLKVSKMYINFILYYYKFLDNRYIFWGGLRFTTFVLFRLIVR